MNRLAACIAVGLGLASWVVTAAVVGKREAWDDPAWFMYALPALFVALVVLGFFFPRNSSLYGPLAMSGQTLALLFSAKGGLSLLPVGLVLMAVMSLPFVLAGLLGALIRTRGRGVPPAVPGPDSPDSPEA